MDVSKVITHHFDFRDFQESFAVMISEQSVKVRLNWSKID